MTKVLDVYLHDVFSGQLIQSESGVLSFAYNHEYIQTNHPALSLSLPLNSNLYENNHARAFFSGLLPDDIVRHRLAKYLGVSEKNPFALLEAIGGECAGALSLYPKGIKASEEIHKNNEVLDDKKLAEILDLLKRRPLLAGSDGIRLSLAGAQDKIAVSVQNGEITLIRDGTPTTHILKPVIAEIKDSVHNELFCMKLAALVGIEVPHVEMHYLQNTPYFLVERYDRIKNKTGIIQRLHQEDFCQAIGIQPEIKYENEGGPSIEKCQQILNTHSSKPAADQIELLKRIIFNYLIGNADAHAKNISLLYKAEKPELAPAYDLLSTEIYSGVAKKMAMKIGNQYKPGYVCLRHWYRLVPDTKTAQNNLMRQLISMAKNCLEKAHELKKSLKKDGIESPIFDEICSVIAKHAKHINT